MSDFNFDECIDRSQHHSAKWGMAGPDCLPMWVADMDFRSPPAAIDAMMARAQHGIFGYTLDPPKLKDVIVERMQRLYSWDISPDDVLFAPGMVLALNAACRAFGAAGDGLLFQSPVYGPFFRAGLGAGLHNINIDMQIVTDGAHTFYYENDYDDFERAAAKPETSIHLLCNPQNPAGFAYSRAELERMAEICLRHNVLTLADEIHSDLILQGQHIPIATLDKDIAQQTLTMIAPSKTYNLAGLGCSVLIAQNPELRDKVRATLRGMGAHVNIMGYEAAYGAYCGGDEWLRQVLAYLRDNRDFALDFIQQHIPQIKTTVPMATYLLWMNMRALPIADDVMGFCQDSAGIMPTAGEFFGAAGKGFARLNFGCPRSTLSEGLRRLRSAVDCLAAESE